MDDKRKGEIAYAVLKHRFMKEGLELPGGLRRDLGNVSQATGIPREELEEFARTLTHEIVDALLPPSTKAAMENIAPKAIGKT